jgi:hypothetical protein
MLMALFDSYQSEPLVYEWLCVALATDAPDSKQLFDSPQKTHFARGAHEVVWPHATLVQEILQQQQHYRCDLEKLKLLFTKLVICLMLRLW